MSVEGKLRRSQFVLAAMAAAGESVHFDPVRIQKLIFLIEKGAADYIGGPHFDFQPYLYGPFDQTVFDVLGQLQKSDQARIRMSQRRAYALTPSGRASGEEALLALPKLVREYFENCAQWVLSLSFGRLLSAIYQKYPDMAANSIVPEVEARYPQALHRSPMPSFLSGAARTLDLAAVLDDFDLQSPRKRDARAIQDVWIAVGEDLRGAMTGFQKLQTDADAS
ncbi:MAG: hypothetical protein OXE51_08505 [Gammaproteobacteria bacterium]|nr:hypothetical protein [Gammaproteobacteria bacterium]